MADDKQRPRLTSRQRAARRGAKTRAVNHAMWKRWETVDKPAQERAVAVLNAFVTTCNIDVRWRPLSNTGHKLMHGADRGRIVKFITPTLVRVKPDGYKRAKDFHIAFWEPIL